MVWHIFPAHRRDLKHHHTLLIAVSLLLSYTMFSRPETQQLIEGLGILAYPGAFLTGLFFTTFLTTIPASAAFIIMGGTVNPFLAAPLGGLGALIGDFLLYRLIRDTFSRDIIFLIRRAERAVWHRRRRHRLLHHFIPVVAGFIIASPLPDELAITLLGLSRFRVRWFVCLSFVMNALGILALLLIGQAV